MIFPVVLGKGKRLFGTGTLPGTLKLTRSSTTSTGVLVATYTRVGVVQTGSFALENPSPEERKRRAENR